MDKGALQGVAQLRETQKEHQGWPSILNTLQLGKGIKDPEGKEGAKANTRG